MCTHIKRTSLGSITRFTTLFSNSMWMTFLALGQACFCKQILIKLSKTLGIICEFCLRVDFRKTNPSHSSPDLDTWFTEVHFIVRWTWHHWVTLGWGAAEALKASCVVRVGVLRTSLYRLAHIVEKSKGPTKHYQTRVNLQANRGQFTIHGGLVHHCTNVNRPRNVSWTCTT